VDDSAVQIEGICAISLMPIKKVFQDCDISDMALTSRKSALGLNKDRFFFTDGAVSQQLISAASNKTCNMKEDTGCNQR